MSVGEEVRTEQGTPQQSLGTAAARNLAIPNRDQQIAVSQRGASGHDIGFQRLGGLAWQFEQAAGGIGQPVELLAERLGHFGAGLFPGEGQHDVQRIAIGERRIRRDLIGAVRQG